MNWKNKITELLHITYPLIQAPMLVVSTPKMVGAVSNEGGLGSIPLGYYSKDKALEEIKAVKKLTSKPFAVNLFAYEQSTEMKFKNMDVLKAIYQRYHIPFLDSLPENDPYPYYTELLDLIVSEAVPVVSFHFGLPDRSVVEYLHSNNIRLMATATCVQEALLIQERGIDIVVAQGIEAGGNRGSFIEGPLPQVGLISLVPQIADAVNIPVVAAGGIAEGRSIAATFFLGAQGVQLGSAFLRSVESGASVSYKNAVADSSDVSSVITNVWSGRYGRCIDNEIIHALQQEDPSPAPFQHFLTTPLRQKGRKEDLAVIQSLWAGQSARYASEQSCSQIFKELIYQAEISLEKSFLRSDK
jgi:Dioxygenases related to 2-nitropropane dioxygenase